MNRYVFGLGFAIAAAAALSGDWIELASTGETLWEGRAGTRLTKTTKGGTPIAIASGRVVHQKTKEITFYQWYVSIEHCRARHGKLVTVDMDGNFKFENDFVLNGGNVASALAEMLCVPLLEQDSKGV
jgi:hypothetical protein